MSVRGALDTRVPLDSRDEIGIVAAAFNTMAEDLNKVTVSKNYVDRIIESMADTLIVISPDLTIETVNRATLDLSGRSNEELVGHPADIIFGIESPEIFLRKLIERQFLRNLETTYIDKNGREIPVLFSGSVMFDAQGAIQGIVCVAQDHTQRRQAEQMLRKSERELRLLSSKILETQENERKQVAQELHDGIGQALTGIKFSIENSLRQLKMGSDANLTRGLETSVTMIQRTIEETRRIAMGLRPSSLDDIGITETILWFCRQFESIYTTIRIETNLGIEEKLLSDALKTTIFRVMQETLNNVVKHSGANLVRLKLLQKGKTVELTIEDNGVGFTPEEEFLKEGTDKGFGLASMKDRAELSGGQFAIQSKEGQGTVVRAFWPETVD